MLAGAVSRADDLFLHVGFAALQALSYTGQSRPFHAEADGLLPAEGACMFALRRLEDAERDGEKILGVIRGVGLSNDGRDRGLLVPSESGQVRAMRQAFELSGLTPGDIDYVECHATGTTVGDATEIASLNTVYGTRPEGLSLGSFKANCGHLITAAGGAGLLKMLAAMEHELMPMTPHVDAPNPALASTSLRVLSESLPWPSTRPRRAGVSAFGFGGNNAHLLVEQYQGKSAPRTDAARTQPHVRVAIVSLGARVADGNSAADFEASLFGEESRVRSRGGVLPHTQRQWTCRLPA
jgi:acyl transferase domain-containing protein